MRRSRFLASILTGVAMMWGLAPGVQAGEIIDIETVFVGNPGNPGELSGSGARGGGAIVGGVGYTYNIGLHEVTAGQYAAFLNAVAATDAHGLYSTLMSNNTFGCKIQRAGTPGFYTYGAAPDWADRPVNFVSWGDAARFTNWLHNDQGGGDTENGAYNLAGTHPYYNPDGSVNNYAGLNAALMAVSREAGWTWALPTENEWYKAAYHMNDGATGNYYDHATSSDSVPSNVLSEPDLGDNATFSASGYTIGSPYYRTEVGAHENSDSPYGTFDQGGNVWEWNEAVIDSSRGLRGGSYSHSDIFLRAANRGATSPTGETGTMGFRVAQVPEPATFSLLAFGSLALLRRRR